MIVSAESQTMSEARHATLALSSRCRCGSEARRALSVPARWMSTHRTSGGIVVYFRCSCGRPRLALVHPIGQASVGAADGRTVDSQAG